MKKYQGTHRYGEKKREGHSLVREDKYYIAGGLSKTKQKPQALTVTCLVHKPACDQTASYLWVWRAQQAQRALCAGQPNNPIQFRYNEYACHHCTQQIARIILPLTNFLRLSSLSCREESNSGFYHLQSLPQSLLSTINIFNINSLDVLCQKRYF